MRKLLILGAFFILSGLGIFGCSDDTVTYEPVAFQWSKVMESPSFGFTKMWDLDINNDNVPLRIGARNSFFGNVFYYNPNTNNGGEGDKQPYVASCEIEDVSGLNSSHIWAAANDDNGFGYIFMYDGSFANDALDNWDTKIFGGTKQISEDLYGVHVFEDALTNKETRVFVGDDGLVIHYIEDSGTPTGSCVLDDWHEYKIPSSPDLKSVWGFDSQHLWAVGELGVIYEYSGAFTWTKIGNGLTSFDLKDIFGLSSGATTFWYAVGEFGSMVYYYNGNINLVTGLPGSGEDLNAIFLRSATSGLAVGDDGYILELGPSGWHELSGITYRDCEGCFISKDLKNKYIATSNDTTWEGTLIRYFEP